MSSLEDCAPENKDSENEAGMIYEVFDEIAANNEGIPGRVEQLKEYDADSLQCIRTLFKEGMSIRQAARGLVGNDSPEAHDFRREIMEKAEQLIRMGDSGVHNEDGNELMDSIAYGLAGCSSDDANEMRQKLFETGHQHSVMYGLTGVEGEKADALRMAIYKDGTGTSGMADTLIGVDSEVSWKLREEFIKGKHLSGPNPVLVSLAGNSSERGQKMRERLEKNAPGLTIMESLAGDRTPESYKKRERLMAAEDKPGNYSEARAMDLMVSIAGDDSPEANKLREKYWNGGKGMHEVAKSLVGINSGRAWEMRKAMIGAGRKDLVVQSLAGGTIVPGPEMVVLFRKNQELAAAKDQESSESALKKGELAAKKEAAAQTNSSKIGDVLSRLLGRK
jgi:hypothetical protein